MKKFLKPQGVINEAVLFKRYWFKPDNARFLSTLFQS